MTSIIVTSSRALLNLHDRHQEGEVAEVSQVRQRTMALNHQITAAATSTFRQLRPDIVSNLKNPTIMSFSAPIGASVVNYIHANSSEREVASEDRLPLEGSGLQPPSLLPCSSNIILRGPRQSGRTSLAMNMAHSIASKDNIPCRRDCGGTSCRCVAVAVLIPSNAEERFPLCCDYVESMPQDLYCQLRALDESTQSPRWNKPALRRVQVHHMASVRDVMAYLLSVQGTPPSQRPVGGIVVEDVDCFAMGIANSGEPTSSELTTEQLMTLTQICK